MRKFFPSEDAHGEGWRAAAFGRPVPGSGRKAVARTKSETLPDSGEEMAGSILWGKDLRALALMGRKGLWGGQWTWQMDAVLIDV